MYAETDDHKIVFLPNIAKNPQIICRKLVKSTIFGRKFVKIAENNDHNIYISLTPLVQHTLRFSDNAGPTQQLSTMQRKASRVDFLE
jgi:hypothetical protein